jgi:hypothetical protein
MLMLGRVNLAILKIEMSRRGALCPDFMILDSIIRKAERDRMKSMARPAERIHGYYGNDLEGQGGAYREGHGGHYSLKNSEAYQNIGRLEEIPQPRALKVKRQKPAMKILAMPSLSATFPKTRRRLVTATR